MNSFFLGGKGLRFNKSSFQEIVIDDVSILLEITDTSARLMAGEEYQLFNTRERLKIEFAGATFLSRSSDEKKKEREEREGEREVSSTARNKPPERGTRYFIKRLFGVA